MKKRSSSGPIAVVALALGFILFFPLSFIFLLSDEANPCLTLGDAGTVANIPDSLGSYDREQLTNAAEIIRAGADLGLSSRDQMIGIMTAHGESALRVLGYGDNVGPDSRGLFQQRASGWGTYEQRMDPYQSALSFFNDLATIKGRESMEPTLAAHRVQVNADPWHYERSWSDAQRIFAALTGRPGDQGAAPSTTSGSSRYNLGPVAPHVAYAANLIGTRFDVAQIGGHRIGNSYDLSGHQAGLAIDVMVPMTPTGHMKGQAIANFALTHAQELSVKYVIWDQRIWSVERADEGWRDMADRGSPSANHKDHPHISFYAADDVPNLDLSAFTDCGPGSSAGEGMGEVGPDGWALPSTGRLTSRYGMRKHPTTGEYKLHSGDDFGAPCGAPIHAAANGVVTSITPNKAYGTLLTIDHGGGIISRYAHMQRSGVLVRQGQQVLAGQTVAKVGNEGYSTGCHLHFEIKIDGNFTAPVKYLQSKGVTLPSSRDTL